MGTPLSDDIANIQVWEGRGVWWVWYVPFGHLAWTPEVDDDECQDRCSDSVTQGQKSLVAAWVERSYLTVTIPGHVVVAPPLHLRCGEGSIWLWLHGEAQDA